VPPSDEEPRQLTRAVIASPAVSGIRSVYAAGARTWHRISASPRVVLALGWLVLAIYAFPGQMTWDSFEYLDAARSGFYTDRHPPAISALWRMLELVVAGPSGMFLVQSAAFVVGAYLVLRRSVSARCAAWVTAALCVFPPTAVPMGTIWKHSLMAGLVLLGFGMLVAQSERARIGGLAALTLAIAMRPIATVAVLPLVLLVFEWRSTSGLRRYATALVAWLAITAVALGTNWLLTDRALSRATSVRDLHDIAGVIKYTRSDLPDGKLEELLAGTELQLHQGIQAHVRAWYRPRSASVLLVGERALWTLPMYGTGAVPQDQRAAIERAWRELVLGDPRAYARHRMQVMKRVLGLNAKERPAAVPGRVANDPEISLGVGVPIKSSVLQHSMTSAATWVADATPLFLPWIYLVVAMLLLVPARRHRDLLALLASGIVAEAVLFVLAVGTDYRQSHWLVLSTCIAIVGLVARRSRA
jgi:hypothetical protein